jgi:hypothetical protein
VIVRDQQGNVVGLVIMHDNGAALNAEKIAHEQRVRRAHERAMRERASTSASCVGAALVALGVAALFVLLLAIVGGP